MSFSGQYLITFTISMLYIIGGTGFVVLMDIKRSKRWKGLSTNSKLILSTISRFEPDCFCSFMGD